MDWIQFMICIESFRCSRFLQGSCYLRTCLFKKTMIYISFVHIALWCDCSSFQWGYAESRDMSRCCEVSGIKVLGPTGQWYPEKAWYSWYFKFLFKTTSYSRKTIDFLPRQLKQMHIRLMMVWNHMGIAWECSWDHFEPGISQALVFNLFASSPGRGARRLAKRWQAFNHHGDISSRHGLRFYIAA